MEKRKLSVIPRREATEDMFNFANRCESKYIATAEKVLNKKILLLTFFKVNDLKKKKKEAVSRTFLSQDDYITQDLTVSNVKWRTAALNMDNQIPFASYDYKMGEYRYNIAIYSDEDYSVIAEFFKNYIDIADRSIWLAIERFQDEVKQNRLERKHDAEIAEIDSKMASLKKVPQKFLNWVSEEALSFSRYLIYKPIARHKAQCKCTYCKKKFEIDRRKVHLKNNEKGVCPACGSKVTYKVAGRMGYFVDTIWVLYTEKTSDGFVLRSFQARRSHDSMGNQSESIEEYGRDFYTFDGEKQKIDSYEYITFKQTNKIRWCHSKFIIADGLNVLYPDNLPEAWAHTPMKYSALEMLSKKAPSSPLRIRDAIAEYLRYPKCEWIIKMGLHNLFKDLLTDYSNIVDLEASTIYDILHLNKLNIRVLQQINGNLKHIRILQIAQRNNFYFNAEQLIDFANTFGINEGLIKQTNKVSYHKLMKYIDRESLKYTLEERNCMYALPVSASPTDTKRRNMASDWLDYLEWCEDLGYDLDNMFWYMPKNFKAVHDRIMKEHQAKQDEIDAEKRRKQEEEAKRKMSEIKKLMEDILDKNKDSDAFAIKGRGLVLVVPKSGDEIRAEGIALHHCVGGYVERVAEGKTNIFFVRKAEAPDVPYFTMEFKDGEVKQCRGYANCDMPSDVKAFVDAFEQKMKMAETNRKTEAEAS